MDLLICNALVRDGEPLVDIAVSDGRITTIDRHIDAASAVVIDAGGRAVCPALLEPHVHLDKALLDARRITPARSQKPSVRQAPPSGRNRATTCSLDRGGCSTWRSAAEPSRCAAIQTSIRFRVSLGVETALALKEEYADLIAHPGGRVPAGRHPQVARHARSDARSPDGWARTSSAAVRTTSRAGTRPRRTWTGLRSRGSMHRTRHRHARGLRRLCGTIRAFRPPRYIARTTIETGRIGPRHARPRHQPERPGARRGISRSSALLAKAGVTSSRCRRPISIWGAEGADFNPRRGLTPGARAARRGRQRRLLFEQHPQRVHAVRHGRSAADRGCCWRTPASSDHQTIRRSSCTCARTARRARWASPTTTGSPSASTPICSSWTRSGCPTSLLDLPTRLWVIKRGAVTVETHHSCRGASRLQKGSRLVKRLPAEVVASLLAATTVFISLPPYHLPPWAIFVSWAGTFAAGGPTPARAAEDLAHHARGRDLRAGDRAGVRRGVALRDRNAAFIAAQMADHLRAQHVPDVHGSNPAVLVHSRHVLRLRVLLRDALRRLRPGPAIRSRPGWRRCR